MNGSLGRAPLAGLVSLVTAVLPGTAEACAVCYGDPGAPASRGLAWAVVALILVVAAVLAGVVAFFVHAVRHERRLTQAEHIHWEDRP